MILYADKITKSIQNTLDITRSRREVQDQYNKKHGITPRTVKREMAETLSKTFLGYEPDEQKEERIHLSPAAIKKAIKSIEKDMRAAAEGLRFEEATELRNQLHYYQKLELLEDNPR